MSAIAGIGRALIDFLLPQDCILCNTETPDALLCAQCLDYLPAVRPPLCRVCGRPAAGHRCNYCKNDFSIDHGRAWLCFVPPVNTLVHHFKYRGKMRLATMLGRAMASIVCADPWLKEADVVVPVPLHWFRRWRRGYNQSSLLARTISLNSGIPCRDLLKRTRPTKSQTTLTEVTRRENVTGAFSVTRGGFTGGRILLIDDVMTTGATLNECARVLKQAGADEVFTCVAAITP